MNTLMLLLPLSLIMAGVGVAIGVYYGDIIKEILKIIKKGNSTNGRDNIISSPEDNTSKTDTTSPEWIGPISLRDSPGSSDSTRQGPETNLKKLGKEGIYAIKRNKNNF